MREEEQPRSVPSHASSLLKDVLHAINIVLGVNVTDASQRIYSRFLAHHVDYATSFPIRRMIT